MAYFALLWKARTIEKYRLNYEKQKLISIRLCETQNPNKTFYQKIKLYNCNVKKKIFNKFQEWYPEGSTVHGFFYYSTTDQTFPNFVLKSIIGFVGGIILTYLFFMFFVFQLAISLVHATIMSSIIGVLLTLGLAFSYRIRCLVFLLIPQCFSRVGRYTLTCYALVLILTGPATNTLKNSEVLSESMACRQEQIKSSVGTINEYIQKPFNALKDSIQTLIDKVRQFAAKIRTMMTALNRLVITMAQTLQSTYFYLDSVTTTCNKKLGTPYEMCISAVSKGVQDCQASLGARYSSVCNVAYVAKLVCYTVQPLTHFCVFIEYFNSNIVGSVEKAMFYFSERMQSMLKLKVNFHHSYTFSSNSSRSASQVAAGVVTEIRRRADPLLTWLSWSSCVTSLFLVLIIFRAKHYQNMFETRSRFDNRYITKELRELDLKRMRQGRETILPLNGRERAKYITTTSFRIVETEKIHLSRSAIFMVITTFKLLIHIIADYSLYWVLTTIRYHGRFETPVQMGAHDPMAFVTGTGLLRRFFEALLRSIHKPLETPPPLPVSYLPDPNPPDLQRYAQIGVLILLLWFFAMFEPYGLRLRHVIMGMYRPERAKARALWLYNHIQRTRSGFMKFARRKLHRENKYSSEAKHTLEYWLNSHIPYACLRSLLGISPRDPACLLCCTIEYCNDCDTNLVRCNTLDCPGVFCVRCFADIGDLCTICLSPADYGDMSDISLEKGSSDEIDDEDCVYCSMRGTGTDFRPDDDDHGGLASHNATDYIRKAENKSNNAKKSNNREKRRHGGWKFTKKAKDQSKENVPLLDTDSDADDESFENDKASGRLIKTTLFTKERKHKSNKGKLKKDRYPKSGSRKIKCKFCFQNQDFCDCESHSLCLLKAEFRRALELATEKGLLRKKERNVKTEHVETQYPVFSKELGVQTSLYLIPKPTKTAICSTSEIEPLLEMPINYQSKRLRRPPWKRSSKNAEKSRSKIPCSSKYSIKCSKAHFLVHKTFRVTKPTKKLRSKCKLFFRQRRPGKTNFGKWFRSMAKRLRSRKLSFSKLGEGDYKNTGTKLSNNTNNSSKGKDEKCGESKEIEAKHVDENTSTINEETEIPNKETKRKNKSRIKLACKKYGDYLRGAKHVATPDATKIASNYKIEDTTPFDSEKFNFKRRKKLLRRDKSNSGQVKSKRDCENTRKYRISSYLSEQEWMKKRHTKKTAPQTSTDIDIQVAKYHPPEDTKAEELKLRTPKNNMKTILSPKLNSHNDLEMLDVVPRYLSENTIARSSINLQDTKKKLFNSMEVQASSSSSNFLSYTNELLAANASPRKPADSYKYSTTQTLDYDMTRSMDYYRSIGMKDFDENDEDKNAGSKNVSSRNGDQRRAQTGFDMRKKREKESKSNMELDKQALPSTSFDHALVSDSICVINDYDEELPLFPSQSKFLRCESHTAAQKKTPKSKECHRKVGKQVSFHLGLPKILSPLATLYSCLFGKKRTINEDVELLRVDEGITVYPIVKSCACQNIYMENPNVKETIKTQPSRMDVGQSISHKELHDAEVNAVHPTCTCAIQSTIAKREACTFCTTKQRRISMVYEGATTARYINETAAPVKYRELFGTMHAECIKRKTNDGIERRYEPKDIHPVKPPMNSSKLSADISKKPKSKAGSRSKADMKSKALPKTKSYYKLKRRGSKPRSRHSSNSSDRSDSSDSGSRTATTVCSRATIRYENEMPRVSNKKHVDVVTKANRSTLTNTRRFADTSTGTSDWWSPLLEKKDKMFDLPRKEVRGKRNAGCQYTRNYAAAVDVPKATQYRAVSFKSQTQIIPSETPRHVEVLSPSRFLIESERYYNEICSPDLRQSVKHRDQHHPVQHHDGRGEVWLGDYRPKRVPKRSKECNTTRRLPSPRGRAQLRVNFEQACRAETSDQKRSPSDSRYSKYRSGVQRSKSANRPTIRDKDSVDLKRADNNLLRGCASSDHISLHCHCNSEDTTTGSC